MKIAQAETLKKSSEGKAPLLLIDDIFGELDHERRNALLDNLPADSQKLPTATAMPWRDQITADTIYEMRDRRLRCMWVSPQGWGAPWLRLRTCARAFTYL